MRLKQNPCIVLIFAFGNFMLCITKCLLFGFSFIFALSTLESFSRKSAADARVKVTTSTRDKSSGLFTSHTFLIILSASTVVLPEPAAADTNKLRFLDSIASFCSLVKFDIFIPRRHCQMASYYNCLFCIRLSFRSIRMHYGYCPLMALHLQYRYPYLCKYLKAQF